MLAEAASVPEFIVDEFEGIRIKSLGIPSLVDGKVRKVWSEAVGCGSCPACGAAGAELGFLFLPKFLINPPHILQFGISNLHCEGQVLRWLKKGTCYRDLKDWQAVGEDNQAVRDMRIDEMLQDFEDILDLKLDRVLPGKNGTSTTGNRVREAFEYPELLARVLKIYPAEPPKNNGSFQNQKTVKRFV